MKQATLGSFLKRPRPNCPNESGEGSSQRQCPNESIDLKNIPRDPADRPPITSYHPNQRDEVRKAYLLQGPCQIRNHKYPSKRVGMKDRKFVVTWYDEFDWVEYSIKANKIYCLYCYVCGDLEGQQGGRRDNFVSEGFDTWGKKEALTKHVGNIDSFHNKARERCDLLMKPKQGINVAFNRQTEVVDHKYKARLRVSVSTCRFLLKNALPFRGHDESSGSLNRGLYIESIKFLREHNEDILKNTLENAPKNNQVICSKSQKQIVECFAKLIVLSICKEIGKDIFAILVDESSDVSKKEQMAIVLRYVDSLGNVKERFIGVVHVKDTSAMTLKNAIEEVLTTNRLSFSQVRGQGYDGASNMRGAFNGLKALVLQQNESAYYIHCFAHQLQLVCVAVAKKHDGVRDLFEQISLVVNVVCASCKRKDLLREKVAESVRNGIGIGELETGQGLNQETTLIRAGDTRWGSHFKTITSLMRLFSEVLQFLPYIEEDGATLQNRNQACGILSYFKTYEFVFYLHLIYNSGNSYKRYNSATSTKRVL